MPLREFGDQRGGLGHAVGVAGFGGPDGRGSAVPCVVHAASLGLARCVGLDDAHHSIFGAEGADEFLLGLRLSNRSHQDQENKRKES